MEETVVMSMMWHDLLMWLLAWQDVDITTNIGRADMANLKLDAWHSRGRLAHEARGMSRGT